MALKPAVITNLNQVDQTVSELNRIDLSKPPYDENWLQDLIHQNPQLVPAEEIEAAFEDLIPIVRELPLALNGGAVDNLYVDNLYITPTGYPVLVEVKLYKNQESRRKVIIQILEYAKEFSSLTYTTLNDKIRKLRKDRLWGENPLYEIIKESTPNAPDESTFVDRVSRNIREGRFLLLILGDGAHDDMSGLADHLIHHSLRYAFGIIQIQLFKMPDDTVLAIPKVMAKTQTIERHVTVVTSTDFSLRVTENKTAQQRVVNEKLEKTSLSLDDFFENMTKITPESVSWLKDFLKSLPDFITPQVGKNGDTLMLKSSTGISLMYISPPTVAFWGLAERFKKSLVGITIVRETLDRIASLVSGEIKIFPSGGIDVRINDKPVPLHAFHGKDQRLIEIFLRFIQNSENADE